MKRILALLLLLLMSAACAESAPLPYAIESGFLIFPAEDGKQHVPIAVKEGFAAKAQELAAENAYLGTPMNLPQVLLPYVSNELTGGEELLEIYATEAIIVMHTRSATDGNVLRWAEWDGRQFAVYRKVIGKDFWLQTSNAAGNLAEIFIEGEPYYQYRLTLKKRRIHLHSVWGEQVYFIIEPHAICNDGTLTTCTNDGYVYGNHPYDDVTDLPFGTSRQAMRKLSSSWITPTGRSQQSKTDRPSAFAHRTRPQVGIAGQVLQPHARVRRRNSRRVGARHHRARPLRLDDDGLFGVRRGYGEGGVCVPAADGQRGASGVRSGRICLRIPRVHGAGLVGGHDALAQRGKLLSHRHGGGFLHYMNSEEEIAYIPQEWLWAGNG